MDQLENSTSLGDVMSAMINILSGEDNIDESIIIHMLNEKYPNLTLLEQRLVFLELDNRIKGDKISNLTSQVTILSQQIVLGEAHINRVNIDNLTGLPNYAAFHHQSCNESKSGNPDIVACLHIQNIGDINTFYGQKAGDHVIQKVAHMLKKYANASIDNHIAVYKCDGANFIVTYANQVLSDDLHSAFNKIHKLPIQYCDPDGNNSNEVQIIDITIFAGATQKGISRYEKYANAKYALRKSEESHEFVLSDDNPKNQIQEIKKSVEVKGLINWAFLNDGFEIFAQEIKNIAHTHSMTKEYECLIRLKNPNYNKDDSTKGPLYFSPAFFLDTIDESGLNKKLTNLVVSKVIEFMKTSKHSFSINITQNDLEDPEFVTRLIEICRESNIDPHRITFEVLESIDLDKNPGILKNIAALKTAGFKLAIDDFGTGLANFSNLLKFCPDKLKIDKKYLTHIAYHTHTLSHKIANFVRPIFGLSQSELTIDQQQGNLQYTTYKVFALLARNNNIQVVAEGVETKEQERVLHGLHINLTQGYLNGYPIELKNT